MTLLSAILGTAPPNMSLEAAEAAEAAGHVGIPVASPARPLHVC
jgi:hypothetical protein